MLHLQLTLFALESKEIGKILKRKNSSEEEL